MKYLLSISFFFSMTTFSMDQSADHDWKPWNSTKICDLEEIQAYNFLHRVPSLYQKIRQNVKDDPNHYTQDIFKRFSNSHIKKLTHIWERFGWPTEQNFDEDCAEAAWIIAIQANHNLDFQLRALLELAESSSEQGSRYYAYLMDRYQVNRGQPQYYGTQINENGLLYPIQAHSTHLSDTIDITSNLETINQRRLSAFLCNLEDSNEYKQHQMQMDHLNFIASKPAALFE